ncbi:MAG: cyclic nucleotide-binding domain-containing protein [Chloroflexi bacterium]|nr:cyclic nucleotide-binding domain-containing protein [Chloroflexota bacterium]
MRSSVYLFGELDDADVDWFVSVGVRRVLQPGTTLLTEGTPASDLFIVLDGTLAATAGSSEHELARLVRGDVAGEISFVDGRPPSATVRAVDQAVVLALPRGVLTDRLTRDGRFAARFYKTLATLLAERLRVSNRRAADGTLQLDEDTFDVDEVAPDTLDALFLAGRRFERLLRQVAIPS